MKKPILTLLSLILTVHIIYAQNSLRNSFALTDSAFVKISVKNIVDTLTFQIYHYPRFPFKDRYSKRISFTKPGKEILSVGISRPYLVHFSVGEEFRTYLVPGDTISIETGYKSGKNIKDTVFYEIANPYHEYFQAKKKKFGYYTFSDFEDSLLLQYDLKSIISLQDYSRVISIFDSLISLNKLFLNNFKNLPEWFVDAENADISYGAAIYTKRFFSRIRSEDQLKIFFIDPEINNPKAIHSSMYFEFLSDYLFLKAAELFTDGNFKTWNIRQIKAQSGLIQSFLSGRIKDYYTICILADSYAFCQTIEELRMIDDFVRENDPDLTQIQLIYLDEDPEKWKDLVNKHPFNGISLVCKGNWATNLKNFYFIDKTPQSVLIDEQGRIICNKCENPGLLIDEIKK